MTPIKIKDADPADCDSPVDVAVVIDSSGSFSKSYFQSAVSFTESLISQMDVNSGRTRVSLVVYSTNATMVFSLSRHTRLTSLIQGVRSATYRPGTTDTAKMLRYLRDTVFQKQNGARDNVNRVAILLTGGFLYLRADSIYLLWLFICHLCYVHLFLQ